MIHNLRTFLKNNLSTTVLQQHMSVILCLCSVVSRIEVVLLKKTYNMPRLQQPVFTILTLKGICLDILLESIHTS